MGKTELSDSEKLNRILVVLTSLIVFFETFHYFEPFFPHPNLRVLISVAALIVIFLYIRKYI